MEKYSSDASQGQKANLVLFLIVFLSIFLNNQKLMFGYNLSLSDFAVVILIPILILSKKMYIPKKSFVFFMVLTIVALSTALLISPARFNYAFNSGEIINNYIKLVSSFLYFLLGYTFFKYDTIGLVYKYYSIAALIIGLWGVVIVFLNLSVFRNSFFFEGPRYIGLMGDPNYFSVIQCTALPYFIREKSIRKAIRVVGCIVLFLAVAVSGSKTGILIFLSYTVFTYLRIVLSGENRKQIIKNLLLFFVCLALLPLILFLFKLALEAIASVHPIFNRVKVMFYDFYSAVSSGGSNRSEIWWCAIELIRTSPIVGVGIGSYQTVKSVLQGSGGVSHNTYLQIMAEWGIPLASTFLIFTFYVVMKHFAIPNRIGEKHREQSIIIRDIFIMLLIGSMSLSLNNARMFWLFLGALYQSLHFINKNINEYAIKAD